MMGDGLKQPLAEGVQPGIEAADGRLKAGDLGRPDIGRAADMPEFLQVGVAFALGGLDPERRVAALPGAADDPVTPLDRIRQGEEGLGAILRGRDQDGVEPMVGDDGEAIALKRCAERVGEPSEILPLQAKRDWLDGQEKPARSTVSPIMRDSQTEKPP